MEIGFPDDATVLSIHLESFLKACLGSLILTMDAMQAAKIGKCIGDAPGVFYLPGGCQATFQLCLGNLVISEAYVNHAKGDQYAGEEKFFAQFIQDGGTFP